MDEPVRPALVDEPGPPAPAGGPAPLAPEDRAAFERALREALRAPEVRAALGRPGAPCTAGELCGRALAAAGSLAAEAAPEYAALLEARSGAAADPPPPGGEGVRALAAALVVLTPLLSAAAAVIFLLLGYGLRLADVARTPADTLVGTGWTAAAVAALAGLAAGGGLAFTAARHRATGQGATGPDGADLAARGPDGHGPDRHGPGGHGPDGHGPGGAAAPGRSAAQAHAAWEEALLRRGLLPWLHRELGVTAGPTTAHPLLQSCRFDVSPEVAGPVPLRLDPKE
ncbi:hypothetical protein [Streptomyces sp. SS162]|uniref:hypothetical protein n=1 Tax=Streptomyces sp. SS162 TaxID=3108484 RepID=UPI002F3F7B20